LWCSPANSFKFQPCGRTPQAAGLTASLWHWVGSKPTQHLARIVYSRDSPGYVPRVTLCIYPRYVPTRVSNPVRSPGFRPSPSGAFQPAAFATGGPPGINGFRPYPGSTAGLSRPLARQYPPRPRVEPEALREDLPGRLRTL